MEELKKYYPVELEGDDLSCGFILLTEKEAEAVEKFSYPDNWAVKHMAPYGDRIHIHLDEGIPEELWDFDSNEYYFGQSTYFDLRDEYEELLDTKNEDDKTSKNSTSIDFSSKPTSDIQRKYYPVELEGDDLSCGFILLTEEEAKAVEKISYLDNWAVKHMAPYGDRIHIFLDEGIPEEEWDFDMNKHFDHCAYFDLRDKYKELCNERKASKESPAKPKTIDDLIKAAKEMRDNEAKTSKSDDRRNDDKKSDEAGPGDL